MKNKNILILLMIPLLLLSSCGKNNTLNSAISNSDKEKNNTLDSAISDSDKEWEEIYNYFTENNYSYYSEDLGDEIIEFINKYNTKDTKILVAGSYGYSDDENGNGKYSLNVEYKDGPAIIFLNTYEPVDWNITGISDNIKAIIYTSYEGGSTLKTDKDVPSIDYSHTYLGSYLSPNCHDDSMLYCEHLGYLEISEFIKKHFGKDLYSFTEFDYDSYSGTIPGTIIDEKKLSELKAEYTKIKTQNEYDNLNPEQLFGNDSSKTWGDYLNPNGDIPTGEFKAFFIDTNNPTKVIKTENVKKIGLSHWNDNNIKGEDLGVYYVGNFEFDKDTLTNIAYDDSGKVRILIDGEVIIDSEKNNSHEEKTYLFKKGTHKIEVEFMSNSFSVTLNLTLKDANRKTDKNTDIKSYITDDTNILLFGVYASTSSDNNLEVFTNYNEDKPAVLILSSYETINWIVKNVPDNLKAIFYTSYEGGSNVTLEDKANVDLIEINEGYFGYGFDVDYSDYGGNVHIENGGITEVNNKVKKVFGKDIYGYIGDYSLSSGIVPEIIITKEDLEEQEKKLEELIKQDPHYYSEFENYGDYEEYDNNFDIIVEEDDFDNLD